MFLYELAIELGVHSSELVDAAGTLGLGPLTPATMLSAAEVAALRQHLAIAGPPRRAVPGSAVPPLPAVPTGPLVAEPPGAASAPVPQAPATWGPPVAPPPGLAPPPPAPTPAAPATGVPAPAVFAPPPPGDLPTFEAAPEPPGSGSGAGLGAPLGPTPPTSWDLHGASPPPPPGPPPTGGDDQDGWSMGQKVAVGVVALLVVGLFGFMLANTGPDAERERELALADQRIEREREEAARTSTTTVPETTTTTAAPEPGRNDVVDLEAFCTGNVGIGTFELRMVAAIGDEDFADLRAVVRDRSAGWRESVDLIQRGAPRALHDEIDTYRTAYEQYFEAISTSSDFEALEGKVDELTMARASSAGQQINAQFSFHCR